MSDYSPELGGYQRSVGLGSAGRGWRIQGRSVAYLLIHDVLQHGDGVGRVAVDRDGKVGVAAGRHE